MQDLGEDTLFRAAAVIRVLYAWTLEVLRNFKPLAPYAQLPQAHCAQKTY